MIFSTIPFTVFKSVIGGKPSKEVPDTAPVGLFGTETMFASDESGSFSLKRLSSQSVLTAVLKLALLPFDSLFSAGECSTMSNSSLYVS
jgi:hypothetical protein